MVRLRAFGTYSMRVSDPGKFLTEIVGTDGEFTTDEVNMQIRNIIVQEFSRVAAGSGVPVLDMAANTAEFGKLVTQAIAPTIAAYGLSIPEFYVENISLPDEVEKAMDKRTSMGVVGDLSKYMQYSAAEAVGQPGSAAGGAMATGMGAGIGMALGATMGGQSGPWGAAQGATAAPPPPPPAPVEKVWHIARDGQTTGPYGRGHLGRMVSDGSFSRDTLVWTAGQDGWKKAGEIDELAQLFTVMPPPPPPGA
jgi:membrane protease subunit (stomatin/prohibitin family)